MHHLNCEWPASLPARLPGACQASPATLPQTKRAETRWLTDLLRARCCLSSDQQQTAEGKIQIAWGSHLPPSLLARGRSNWLRDLGVFTMFLRRHLQVGF